MTTLTLVVLLSTGAVAQQPPARPVAPDMVIKWNDIALQAIRADRTPPPVAARNLAIMHTAIFDAVMAIERTHRPYLIDAEVVPGTSAEAAVSGAAHRALTSLYPKQRDTFELVLARCLADLPRNEAREQGLLLGRYMAERMLEARRDDGADRAARKHPVKQTPGNWQPTAPKFEDSLLPGWGYVRAFAIRKGTQPRLDGPPKLTSKLYTDAFNEVKRYGGKDSSARTEEQTQIAYFWADDLGTATPPGHWNKIAQGIARTRGNSLAENARIFAHLNITLADAAALCWMIKFTYDFWRPITAIQNADRDGNPDTEKNAGWTPLLDTPPFPAYTSGHSTFSAAAAASLAQSFGSDEIRFTTTSDALPGVTRSFKSLWCAAEEAGMSRVYGGIHWQFDNTDGLKTGRAMGEYVSRNTLQPRRR